MAISFQPAAPVAPEINARFGAADQYNRSLPVLASLYEAAGRNFTQASAGTAQNITQGNIASAENQTRRTLQGFQIDADEGQQRREIQAREAAQMRQIQAQQIQQRNEENFQMARMDIAITQKEQQENVARVNGLAEIERQLSDKTLTPEQAADARYELTTGINLFQRRASYQQAKAAEARAAQVEQEMVAMTKSQAMSEKFQLDMAEKGITIAPFVDPETGRARPLAYDTKTGRLYNPFLEHAGKEEKPGKEKDEPMPGWEHVTDKKGEFDYPAAERHSKQWAKYDPKISKELEAQKNDKDAVEKWVTQNVTAMRDQFEADRDNKKLEKARSAVPGLPAPSAPPPVQPTDPVTKLIQSRNLEPAQAQAASQINAAIQAIMSKPKQSIRQTDIAEVERLRNELAKYVQ